jgi:hypothetical protein
MLCACVDVQTVTCNFLPPIQPTKHLMAKQIGTKPWHGYAWACREIISKYGDIPKGNGTQSEKKAYHKFMHEKVDVCTEPFYPEGHPEL